MIQSRQLAYIVKPDDNVEASEFHHVSFLQTTAGSRGKSAKARHSTGTGSGCGSGGGLPHSRSRAMKSAFAAALPHLIARRNPCVHACGPASVSPGAARNSARGQCRMAK